MDATTHVEPEPVFADRFISAGDGLRLHVRDYDGPEDGVAPAICLPGLTRSARDFHDLALALAHHDTTPRRVITLESRGRGQSDYDQNWHNYNVVTELHDLITVLTALNIEHAGFVGTSRGGILIMLLAAARPGAIRSAVLNDVGPVIEVQGLLRIKHMLADLKPPASWDEAVAASKRFGAVAFPAFTDADWEKMARQTYRDDNGQPVIDFDLSIANTIAEFDAGSPAPTLWPQFCALAPRPTLVVRGELSTLLTEETVEAMIDAHPRLGSHTVPDEGHAPTLWDKDTQTRIADHLAAAD